MKFFKNFFLIIVIFLLTLSILKAEDKVAYLDIDFILTNTLAGKSLLNNLKNQENIKINEFKSKDEKFRNDEKKKAFLAEYEKLMGANKAQSGVTPTPGEPTAWPKEQTDYTDTKGMTDSQIQA